MRYLGDRLTDIIHHAFSPALLRDKAPLILAAIAVGSIGSLVTAVARSPEAMAKVDPLWQTLHQRVIDYSAQAGLLLFDITVSGRHYTQSEDVLEAVRITQGQPMLAMDPEAIRQRLESLPWIKHASVERLFPHEIRVTLIERTPIALWQSPNGSYHLVDPDGVVIEGGYSRFSHLPVVVGDGAPEAASDLLAMLNTQPELAPRIKAAVRFGARRWDLWIDGFDPDGVQVRLPELQAEESLARLAQLEREQHILRRDVSVIDLRLDDRLIVRKITDPTPENTDEGSPGKNTVPGKDKSQVRPIDPARPKTNDPKTNDPGKSTEKDARQPQPSPAKSPATGNPDAKNGIHLRGPAQDA